MLFRNAIIHVIGVVVRGATQALIQKEKEQLTACGTKRDRASYGLHYRPSSVRHLTCISQLSEFTLPFVSSVRIRTEDK